MASFLDRGQALGVDALDMMRLLCVMVALIRVRLDDLLDVEADNVLGCWILPWSVRLDTL